MVEASLVSQSPGGKRAQVTVILGEGREKHSVTRHLIRKDGRWMGRNPDEAAVARTQGAQAALADATSLCEHLESLKEISLEEIERVRAEFRREGRENAALPEELRDHRALLLGMVARKFSAPDMKARMDASAADAAAALETAQKHLEKVRVPKQEEFTF